MPHAKHCTYLSSRNAHKGLVRWVLVLTHFTDEETAAHRSDLLKFPQLGSGKSGLCSQVCLTPEATFFSLTAYVGDKGVYVCSTPPDPHPPRWCSWFPCHIGGHPSSTPEHSTHTPASLHRGVCDSRASPRTQLDRLWPQAHCKGVPGFPAA